MTQAKHTPSIIEAYNLGAAECDSSFGRTYDDDPGSDLSTAYDLGRTHGETAAERDRLREALEWIATMTLESLTRHRARAAIAKAGRG